MTAVQAPTGLITLLGMTLMVAPLATLGGCAGFQPLYGHGALAADLSAISIQTPQTRTGFLLRQQLADELALKKDVPARYRLSVTFDEVRRPRGLNLDDSPTRYELRLNLTYVLVEAATGKVMLKASKPVDVSTDSVVQPYASIAAQQDAEQRAASQAAEMIRTDIAMTLAHE